MRNWRKIHLPSSKEEGLSCFSLYKICKTEMGREEGVLVYLSRERQGDPIIM